MITNKIRITIQSAHVPASCFKTFALPVSFTILFPNVIIRIHKNKNNNKNNNNDNNNDNNNNIKMKTAK